MVVNRSDVKKRRKEIDAMDGSVHENPKRTKVHAQRKFAQGSSSLSSVTLTPIKDKDKLKSNGSILSSELIPLKRPKTEDFLTFLCFRGSSILPPQLNFFNVATFQDIQDEESSMSARDRSPNSSIDLTSVGQRLQKILEIEEISNVVVNDDIKRDATKRRATAVQAIRRKYQEQRLAKQRANTINKVTQKVNGKRMISTRSSAIRLEDRPALQRFHSKSSVPPKCSLKDMKIPKPLDSLNLAPLTKRGIVIRRPKYQDFQCSTVRRCGLRSSAISPLRKGRVENEMVSSRRATKSILSESKTFLSSVSDFSSDDDQPLVKTKLTQQRKEFTREVIRRITSRSNQTQTRILTRSRVQQQHGQHHLSKQHIWPVHEVNYRQQPRDQVHHHHLHYLYSQRRHENSAAKLPVHVQIKRLPSSSPQQIVSQQITTRMKEMEMN